MSGGVIVIKAWWLVRGWLMSDSIPDERRLSRAVAGYWNRLHLDVPVAITDNFHSSGFWMQDHLLYVR